MLDNNPQLKGPIDTDDASSWRSRVEIDPKAQELSLCRNNVMSYAARPRNKGREKLLTGPPVKHHNEHHAASKRIFEMNVVKFRARQTTAFSEKRALDASTNNICELLDLSRYELCDRSRNALDSQKDGPDDFKHRMRANIMALIFLVALAALAAAGFLKAWGSAFVSNQDGCLWPDLSWPCGIGSGVCPEVSHGSWPEEIAIRAANFCA
jgi:hypothetical protein